MLKQARGKGREARRHDICSTYSICYSGAQITEARAPIDGRGTGATEYSATIGAAVVTCHVEERVVVGQQRWGPDDGGSGAAIEVGLAVKVVVGACSGHVVPDDRSASGRVVARTAEVGPRIAAPAVSRVPADKATGDGQRRCDETG